MSAPLRKPAGIALLCLVLIVAFWYVEAEDFSEARVAGLYVFTHDGITQKLTLYRDHTFEQEDTTKGDVRKTSGTWRVFSSTGHMSFSSSFIDAPEAWRGRDEHEVFGLFKNYFGLVSLTFASDTEQVKAFKKLFS